MKKFLKSKTSMILATALTVSALAGCSAPKVDEGTAEPAPATEASGEQIVIKAVMKDMVADDPVAIKYLEEVSKRVSAELGKDIKIELVPISEGTYSESMGLLLQSGEIPDLMYFQGGDYQFAITQGILEDLTPYIEKSTNVKAALQPFNEERLANYPYLLWLSPDRIKVPLVRTDWFESTTTGKTLLEDATPENYKAFLQELKDTNGLGYAYTVPGDLVELDTTFNSAFGVTSTWLEQDGAYVYSKVSEAEKAKLAYYADLYKSGLLDSEYLSKKWDTKEEAFYNGQAAVVAGTAGAVTNVYNTKMTGQNGETAALTVLPPAKGVGQFYTASDVSKESRGWAISAYSEHKEETFAILEYMASQEGQIFDKLGYEGEHHTIDGGKYTLTDKIQEWYPRFHESIKTLDVEFNPETPYYSPAALDSLEKINTYGTLDNKFVLPDEYVTYQDAGDALYAEYAAEVVSGKKSIDTFDDFVQQWNALGGDKITQYANEQLKK